MKRITQRQMTLHHAVSIVGGFLGSYTIFNHFDFFCNAQTGNLIRLVQDLCRGDLSLVWFMLLGFVTYCGGNAFYVLVRRRSRLSMKIVSLIVTSAAVVIVGACPFITNHILACIPLVFAAPVQWNAFKTAGGNSSSTIFSSNNVRQASMLLTKYLFVDKDKATLARARFYWATLLCFHIGVAFGCLTSIWLGTAAIWFCFVPILLSALAYYRYISAKWQAAALVGH